MNRDEEEERDYGLGVRLLKQHQSDQSYERSEKTILYMGML